MEDGIIRPIRRDSDRILYFARDQPERYSREIKRCFMFVKLMLTMIVKEPGYFTHRLRPRNAVQVCLDAALRRGWIFGYSLEMSQCVQIAARPPSLSFRAFIPSASDWLDPINGSAVRYNRNRSSFRRGLAVRFIIAAKTERGRRSGAMRNNLPRGAESRNRNFLI